MADVGMPEYKRIRASLRSQLEDGEFKPGDRIPTERELAQRFGVAHMTVRHAVDGLVRDGLLARRRGAGTFVVKSRAVSRTLNRLQGFSDDIRASANGNDALEISSQVLELAEIAAEEETSRLLELPLGSAVVSLRRIRNVAGTPTAISHVLLPVRIAPRLAEEDFSHRSLYAYLTSVGVQFGRAEQSISAVAATDEQAAQLHVPLGSPLLASERLTRDSGNIPVEFARTWTLPDLPIWVEMHT